MQELACLNTKCRKPIYYKPTDLRIVCACGATYIRESNNHPVWGYTGMAQESRDPIDEFLHKAAQHQAETPAQDWPEQRVDIIGQNGNTGEHYAEQPLPATPVVTAAPLDADLLPEYVLKDPGGYAELASVLQAAFNQAAYGKGAERHANSRPFTQQPMQKFCEMYGVGFALGQAAKKMEEAQRMPTDAAIRELLGAIVYIAGAAIHLERKENDHA